MSSGICPISFLDAGKDRLYPNEPWRPAAQILCLEVSDQQHFGFKKSGIEPQRDR